jgi:hypothetical protein
MVCAPRGALPVIATGTVKLVAVAAVGVPAVTPGPLNVTDDELEKCVKLPVIVTGTSDRCWPLFGFSSVITGVPATTVKLFGRVAVSPPVVTVTSRLPVAAVPRIVMFAVA